MGIFSKKEEQWGIYNKLEGYFIGRRFDTQSEALDHFKEAVAETLKDEERVISLYRARGVDVERSIKRVTDLFEIKQI